MTIEVVTEHQCARRARFLCLVTATPEPPTLSRDRMPDVDRFTVVGDGVNPADWTAARAWAEEERRGLDARIEIGWVWIGHDQYFYHSDWQFFHCFGPADWESPQYTRSMASQCKVEARAAERKRAEREAGAAAALANKANRGKKKKPRNLDAIADQDE